MGYYIDLRQLDLESYKTRLLSAYLPPSRMILKEQMNERFSYFGNIGIKNVAELIQLLNKKDKIAELSKVSCFSEEYLVILLRELTSIHPKPNKIEDFIDVSYETIEKLKKTGIKNSEQLYSRVLKTSDRLKLSEMTGIHIDEILKLAKLCDLSRIKYVGVTFAHILYVLGIDTAEKASRSDPVELLARISQLNKDQNIFKGQIGINDIRIFVNSAKEVSLDIEY